jgi:hypothetical protein
MRQTKSENSEMSDLTWASDMLRTQVARYARTFP